MLTRVLVNHNLTVVNCLGPFTKHHGSMSTVRLGTELATKKRHEDGAHPQEDWHYVGQNARGVAQCLPA